MRKSKKKRNPLQEHRPIWFYNKILEKNAQKQRKKNACFHTIFQRKPENVLNFSIQNLDKKMDF